MDVRGPWVKTASGILVVFKYHYVSTGQEIIRSILQPSWICDDVIILHPVINFHGPKFPTLS